MSNLEDFDIDLKVSAHFQYANHEFPIDIRSRFELTDEQRN